MEQSEKNKIKGIKTKDMFKGKGKLGPAFLPGKFHGQRSLVDYSPWGLKESDMIEHLALKRQKKYDS